ncbi:MAG: hypothetical protein LBV04_01880, partial [Deferribacteraceae bacterium]|nr:hypothetical protein [Deferribacteraceae bacterium]
HNSSKCYLYVLAIFKLSMLSPEFSEFRMIDGLWPNDIFSVPIGLIAGLPRCARNDNSSTMHQKSNGLFVLRLL